MITDKELRKWVKERLIEEKVVKKDSVKKFLLMKPLGRSLHDIFKKCKGKKFSLKTVATIGIELVFTSLLTVIDRKDERVPSARQGPWRCKAFQYFSVSKPPKRLSPLPYRLWT